DGSRDVIVEYIYSGYTNQPVTQKKFRLPKTCIGQESCMKFCSAVINVQVIVHTRSGREPSRPPRLVTKGWSRDYTQGSQNLLNLKHCHVFFPQMGSGTTERVKVQRVNICDSWLCQPA